MTGEVSSRITDRQTDRQTNTTTTVTLAAHARRGLITKVHYKIGWLNYIIGWSLLAHYEIEGSHYKIGWSFYEIGGHIIKTPHAATVKKCALVYCSSGVKIIYILIVQVLDQLKSVGTQPPMPLFQNFSLEISQCSSDQARPWERTWKMK